MSQCANTKVVMSGYSQGGQLVHNAAKQLPSAVASKVAAAVIFGDPGTIQNEVSMLNPKPFTTHTQPSRTLLSHTLTLTPPPTDNGAAVTGVSAAKTKVICHNGDNICQHGNLVLTPHLTYSQNAGEAAQFVKAATQ